MTKTAHHARSPHIVIKDYSVDGDGLFPESASIGNEQEAEHRRIEEKLKQLAAIVESSDDAIMGLNLSGIIESWNPAAERIYGYAQKEAIGKSFAMLVLPEEVGRFHERLAQVERGDHIDAFETVRVGKNGERVDVFSRFSPILDSDGRIVGASAISRDISKQKKLEAQLHQSQKMEAFGQLAGGVAHDFNNLLTVIGGFTEILTVQLPTNDPKRALLSQITQAAARATSLTQQLLAFSRQQVLDPKILDLNLVVQETEKMLRRLIGEDIELATALQPNLWSVKVDPGQIQQVILNLAVNARDAMPQGGKLSIQTQNVELDEHFIKMHLDVKAGKYAVLAVSDTGCGIPTAIRSRIYEPFFTTKSVGKGTGLGLAVVEGIVKQSGGGIGVYSEVGIGTSFKIYLPVTQEHPANAAVAAPAKPRGTETVLLVEDQDDVRAMIALALRNYGYVVVQAANGNEAIELAERNAGKIDLLLTDVVMPAMSGSKLAEMLQTQMPNLKVLFLSGYMDDAIVRHGVLQANAAFLQKPFTPIALAQKVREVLDAKALP